MANTTYSSELFRPHSASISQILREVFAATPLAIFLSALKQGR